MSSTRHLDREIIASAALAIADSEGFAAVSMRRVAQELGLGTMTLYYYVKTKAELIAAMDDALMAKVVVSTLPKNWREALTMIAMHTRDVFLRHPWALSSMQSAPPGVNAMRHMEQCLQALSGTNMSVEEKLTLLALVDDFVFGYALRETAGDHNVDIGFAKKQLASGAFPQLAEVFGRKRALPGRHRFAIGLEALLGAAEERIPIGEARRKNRRRNCGC